MQYTNLCALFYACSISLCIMVDIFQYSMPLPFLPQYFEDAGHESLKITTAIGGYYWTGFLGGIVITSSQIYRVLNHVHHKVLCRDIRRYIIYLIIGLFLGTFTLIQQAVSRDIRSHIICRLLQGFIGAYLFFYSYILSMHIFTGPQRIMSLTMNTIALNLAEISGPLFGASLYSSFGWQGVFTSLAMLSIFNQILLVFMYIQVPRDDESSAESSPSNRDPLHTNQLMAVLRGKLLWISVLIIAPAALIKAAVENVLPYFTKHQLGFDEMWVGASFTVIALFFVLSSITIGYTWSRIHFDKQICLVLSALFLLSATVCLVIGLFMVTHSKFLFFVVLALYGCSLGLTHAPSAYMLATFTDSVENAASKEVANGIWNTLWELGGSIGFLVSGLASSKSIGQQDFMLTISGFICLACCIIIYKWSKDERVIDVAETPAPEHKHTFNQFSFS